MKRVLLLLTSAFFVIALVGCSSTPAPAQGQPVPSSAPSTSEPVPASPSEPVPSSEPEPDPAPAAPSATSEPGVEPTKLFDEIYAVYANRKQSFEFSSVVSFIESSGYESSVTEPTETAIGEITVEDGSGDHVYFAFLATGNGTESIMTVSYLRAETNSEVALSNYSSDGDPTYDSFSTHVIGEKDEKVSGVDEQIAFLFN